jgi:hypothetical protein
MALTFSLEPWGEQYRLAPEETFEIVARGPEGDSLEVEFAVGTETRLDKGDIRW